MGDYTIHRCVLCGSTELNRTTTDTRFEALSCQHCDAEFVVEYDPPDAPHIRGRIEIGSRRSGPPRLT